MAGQDDDLEDVDRRYVERLGKHANFPVNDESLKLFREYRDMIKEKQLAKDIKLFLDTDYLTEQYLLFSKERPAEDSIEVACEAMLFASHVIEIVLGVTAHREASMSLMLQIYEDGAPNTPGKKSKPNLKLIK